METLLHVQLRPDVISMEIPLPCLGLSGRWRLGLLGRSLVSVQLRLVWKCKLNLLHFRALRRIFLVPNINSGAFYFRLGCQFHEFRHVPHRSRRSLTWQGRQGDRQAGRQPWSWRSSDRVVMRLLQQPRKRRRWRRKGKRFGRERQRYGKV